MGNSDKCGLQDGWEPSYLSAEGIMASHCPKNTVVESAKCEELGE